MRKLLILAATLSLGTLALASDMDFTPPVEGSTYDQILAAQVNEFQSTEAANLAAREFNAQPESFGNSEPGSMASDENSQNASENSYDQTIAAQAQQNRLAVEASRF